MLALSAELARYPLSRGFPFQSESRSSVCGSTIALGLATNEAGGITRIGLKVSACAVGQSSAAILAGEVEGRTLDELGEALSQTRRWLAGEGNLPDWPRLDAIAGALPHPGRHGALLLPWEAAIKALSSTQ